MASPFADALMSSMTASFDPMTNITRNLAEQMVDGNRTNLIKDQANTVDHIEALLDKAKAKGSDQSVIDTYQKLLAKLSA